MIFASDGSFPLVILPKRCRRESSRESELRGHSFDVVADGASTGGKVQNRADAFASISLRHRWRCAKNTVRSKVAEPQPSDCCS